MALLARFSSDFSLQIKATTFTLLSKSRAGEFLAGTFKRACMMVIKRQDLKTRAVKFVLVTRLGGNQVDAGTRELQEASEGFTGDPD